VTGQAEGCSGFSLACLIIYLLWTGGIVLYRICIYVDLKLQFNAGSLRQRQNLPYCSCLALLEIAVMNAYWRSQRPFSSRGGSAGRR